MKSSRRVRPILFTLAVLIVSSGIYTLKSIRTANLEKRLQRGHPLFFEANRGQMSDQYRFLARDRFGTFLLGGNELVYGSGRETVRMVFAGANAQPQLSGLDLQPGRVNYLLGNDAVADYTPMHNHSCLLARPL